ncbi:MAG: NUDIX domain-containing protein [bacterium]|nr:NUDIX domain-containing protein [bacterium]
MKRLQSFGAVIFRRGPKGEPLFLVLRFVQGHWEFPRGTVDPRDADSEATARREIFEEAGIADVTFIPGFTTEVSFAMRDGKHAIPKTVTLFLAEVSSPRVRLSSEHTQYRWLPYRKARASITYDGSKKMLDDAYQFLQK